MKKLLLLFSLLYLSIAYSQKTRQDRVEAKDFNEAITKARASAPNGIVRCATHEHLKSKQKRGVSASDEEFEKWLAPKMEEIKRLRQIGRLPSVIRIPVVVHVIHDGDALGTGENIADAQVLSQITVLNQDFRRMAATPGFGAGVDTTIEFCMAQRDPSGNPTTGIDRRNLGVAGFDSASVEGNLKPNTIWDPTKYFNIWTARFSVAGDLNGVLGYAQFPTGSGLAGMPTEDCIAGEASTDGLIIAYNAFGSRLIYPAGSYSGTQYDEGRTSTHEIGHMFGLRHTWGDGDCTVDDFCADTPNCDGDYYAGEGTGGCIAPVQCGGTRQIQNYMDYSDDSCMNIFTQNQKDRMLAVIMNSPRRDDLLVSPVCSAPQSSIQFKRLGCDVRMMNADVTEGNGCSYTEYTVPLNIDKAPTANAVVTFAIDGTSVANANDITIVTPTVTFNSGITTDRNLVFRVLNDNYVEPNEDLVISFTVNAGGGDAFANAEGNKLKVTILNDDVAASPTTAVSLISENFDPLTSAIATYDDDGDGENWAISNEAAYGTSVGFSGNFAVSNSWIGSGALTPDNYLVTSALSIPAGVTSASLSYTVGTIEAAPYQFEHYAVYVGAGSVPATISGQTPVFEETLSTAQSFRTVNVNLNAYIGQTVYLAFRHYNCTDMNTLIVDNINLSYQSVTQVQTAINTGTSGNNLLKGSGSGSFYDSSASRIMTDVTVNDTSDHGCTTIAVTRSQASVGAGAAQYGPSVNVADYAVSKEFTITPANIVANGNTTIKFYFTAAEILAWESFTGINRSQLYVVKNNGTTKEIRPLTIGAFGTEVTFTATFTTGIAGKYTFARQTSLGVSDFDFEDFALYPNPNKGDFTVKFTSNTNNDVKINVHDLRGRQVFEKSYSNNGAFNQEVNLNAIQSGVYLVSIIDGDKKTVKRIVIE